MTAEQLQAARAAHWRQNQSPLLTLDEAQSWLRQHPLCLYLPRRAQLPMPAPSFVEACIGSSHATPGPDAIAQAHELLTRLIASGTVVALNLLGAVSEQPDFLAHSEALPFILSLRADSDWKHAPQKSSGHKVSPLVLELWKALDKEGALTAAAARETLGRELTEAAVLRGLCELWQALRISPAFAEEGQPTRWELLRVRYREALATGSATSQVTAISLLVSMYLQSVYAASSEEIEIFLSPLASRSRVREAVRGLSATRQIHSLSMDAQTYHFIEDGLPEFAEPAEPAAAAATGEHLRAAPRDQTGRRPLPAQRRDQSASRMVPSAPPRPAPVAGRTRPEPRPESRPERPEPKPAQPSRPAAGAGWKSAKRPGQPSRAPWQQAAKPATREMPPRWKDKDGGARAGSGARPAPGSRPPRPPARTFSRPDARPTEKFASRPERGTGGRPAGGQVRPDARGRARPDARGGARPDTGPRSSPGAARGGGPWAGKRQRPADLTARTRAGQASGSAPRPPRAGGRDDSPLRPPAARGEQRPGSSGRAGSYRAPGRPPATAANRPSVPASGRPPSRPPGRFVSRGERRSGPPSAGFSRERGARPARFEAPGRPMLPAAGAKGTAGYRPGPPRSADRTTRDDRPGNEKYAKSGPKPGGKFGARFGPKSGPKSGAGRAPGNPPAGPPFAPKTRSPKPWPRSGEASGKPRPGKPAGRKPDRKRTGA